MQKGAYSDIFFDIEQYFCQFQPEMGSPPPTAGSNTGTPIDNRKRKNTLYTREHK